jgi:lipopolysaccharide/colanic/teichoic acid biosynthesis glycosyltransferase
VSTHARTEISTYATARASFGADAAQPSFLVETAFARRSKRCLDLCVTLMILPLAVVLAVPICLLILVQGGSPLYRHLRVGQGGRLFHCYKFRSMALDADAQLRLLLDSNEMAREEWQQQFKLTHDPRVTRLGRLLRKSSLDELPQIWNVLRGEMSLVGPRPVIPEELEKYGDRCAAYLACRPGLSGLWQISGRTETGYEKRVALDFAYAQNWSLGLDLRILFLTVPAVLRTRGAC